MAAFLLPANSKIKKGKHFPALGTSANVRRYAIYRYDPDSGENPRVDNYDVDMDDCGPMVLDALMSGMLYVSIFTLCMQVSWPLVAATQFTAYMAILNMSTVIGLKTSGVISDSFSLPAIFVGAGILQLVVIGIFPFIDVHQARKVLGHEAHVTKKN